MPASTPAALLRSLSTQSFSVVWAIARLCSELLNLTLRASWHVTLLSEEGVLSYLQYSIITIIIIITRV